MFEWNHNTFYHNFILGHLPRRCNSVLDIGSGEGLFSSKLSFSFREVYSLEPDIESINFSKDKYKSLQNIIFISESFLEFDFRNLRFDFIVAVASIHHMNFRESLEKMKGLLNPGGKIVILGLYKESTVIDLLISLAAVIPNYIMNVISTKKKSRMVTTEPTMTISEIKQTAKDTSSRIGFKRHLFWRYSIIFENI